MDIERKILTILLFLFSNDIVQAQFDFSTEKRDDRWVCEMEESQEVSADLTRLYWEARYDLELKYYGANFYVTGLQKVGAICNRMNKSTKGGFPYTDGVTVYLDLANGERLSFANQMVFNCYKKNEQDNSGIYSCNVNIILSGADSNMYDLNGLSDSQIDNYVGKRLSNYDITCISLLGQRFPITKIRTAPTFDSMFTTLGQKIGRTFANGNNRNNSATSTDVSAKFKRTWLELDVYQNHVKGLRVHANLDVWNAKGKELRMECFFFDSSGRPLRDFNQNFYSGDGQVCAVTSFRPSYDASTYSDLSVFIPYSELHLSSGYHTIECRTAIFYGGYQYAEDNGLRFRIH